MVVVAEASVVRCNLFVEVRSFVLMFENLGVDAIAFFAPEKWTERHFATSICMNILFLVTFQ